MKGEEGIALVSALFICALLALLAAGYFSITTSRIELLKTVRLTQRLSSGLNKAAVKGGFGEEPAARFSCNRFTESAASSRAEKLLCALSKKRFLAEQLSSYLSNYSAGNGSAWPLIDYGSVFETADECPNRSLPDIFRLEGLQSIRTCNAIPGDVSSLHGNLYLIEPCDIPAHLSVAGALIAAVLTIKQSSLVIAGGSIVIKELILTDPAAEVTIVSATGGIAIERIQGTSMTRLIARVSILVPDTLSTARNNLLPPQKEFEVVSFSPFRE